MRKLACVVLLLGSSVGLGLFSPAWAQRRPVRAQARPRAAPAAAPRKADITPASSPADSVRTTAKTVPAPALNKANSTASLPKTNPLPRLGTLPERLMLRINVTRNAQRAEFGTRSRPAHKIPTLLVYADSAAVDIEPIVLVENFTYLQAASQLSTAGQPANSESTGAANLTNDVLGLPGRQLPGWFVRKSNKLLYQHGTTYPLAISNSNLVLQIQPVHFDPHNYTPDSVVSELYRRLSQVRWRARPLLQAMIRKSGQRAAWNARLPHYPMQLRAPLANEPRLRLVRKQFYYDIQHQLLQYSNAAARADSVARAAATQSVRQVNDAVVSQATSRLTNSEPAPTTGPHAPPPSIAGRSAPLDQAEALSIVYDREFVLRTLPVRRIMHLTLSDRGSSAQAQGRSRYLLCARYTTRAGGKYQGLTVPDGCPASDGFVTASVDLASLERDLFIEKIMLALDTANLKPLNTGEGLTSAGATPPKPGATTPKPGATTPKPGVTTPKPGATTPKPGVTTPKPGVTTPKPVATVTEVSKRYVELGDSAKAWNRRVTELGRLKEEAAAAAAFHTDVATALQKAKNARTADSTELQNSLAKAMRLLNRSDSTAKAAQKRWPKAADSLAYYQKQLDGMRLELAAAHRSSIKYAVETGEVLNLSSAVPKGSTSSPAPAAQVVTTDEIQLREQLLDAYLDYLRQQTAYLSAPKAGTVLVSERVRVYNRPEDRHFPAVSQGEFLLDSVQMKVEDGSITDLKAIGSVRGRQLLFESHTPIGISSDADLNDHNSWYRRYLWSQAQFKSLSRDHRLYIQLDELLRYFPSAENEDRSPANGIYTFRPHDPLARRTLTKEATAKILQARVYTDLAGISNGRPNGLVQVEISKKIMFGSPWTRNSPGVQFRSLGYLMPLLALTKIEQQSRHLPLTLIGATTAAPFFRVNTIDLLRYTNLRVGVDLNLLSMRLPQFKSDYSLDLSLHLHRVDVRDSTRTAQPAFPRVDSTLNVASYGLHVKWRIRPDSRYGLQCRLGYLRYALINSARTGNQLPIEQTPKPGDIHPGAHTVFAKYFFQGVMQYELTGWLQVADNSLFFFRPQFSHLLFQANRNFFQMQVGYQFDVFTRRRDVPVGPPSLFPTSP